MKSRLALLLLTCSLGCQSQNKDPQKIKIITSDIDNFWNAFDKAKPDFDAAIFEEYYFDKGTQGLKYFNRNKIKGAGHLSKVIASHSKYYTSIRSSTLRIKQMENEIKLSSTKLKDIYPDAIFPPVYFVIGALGSGGTSSNAGLIIGADMYGLTDETPMDELNDWLRSVVKPVDEIPHIVAHELVHFQQKYDGKDLLSGCIKEGSADFIAELISGKHINEAVHEFANPKETELWNEFKNRMHDKDFTGWLYSSTDGRPNDVGYWVGYKISKAYYDKMPDKQKAIYDILHIKDFDEFLERSGYNPK